MRRRNLSFVVVLILGTLAGHADATQVDALSSYHIGNSLTYDSRPMWLDDFVPGHQGGWHIRGEQHLTYIWDHPEDTTKPITDFGRFDTALPNNAWDVVTLQPFNNAGTPVTLLDEQTAALNFINLTRTNPANQDTVFYLHAAWPEYTDLGQWEDPFIDADDTPVARTRAFYTTLLNRVRANTDAQVYLIPTGEVVWELGQRMQAGLVPELPGISLMYRDFTHMTYDIGRYVAATTTYSTLYGTAPHGLTIPPDPEISTGRFPITAELYAKLNDTVWDVVAGHPQTNIPEAVLGDTDSDFDIDDSDLGMIFSQYTGPQAELTESALPDLDRDGDVDESDLAVFFSNYTGFQPETPIFNKTPQQGDTDGDGDVDDTDLALAFAWYGPDAFDRTPIFNKNLAQGDFDRDRDIDDADLGLAFANYTGPLAPSVPEPASLVCLVATPLLLRRRRI